MTLYYDILKSFTLFFVAGLIEEKKCQGSEEFLKERLNGIERSWTTLIEACHLKTKKLMEASEQQKFSYGMQDIEFWLGEVSLSTAIISSSVICFKEDEEVMQNK